MHVELIQNIFMKQYSNGSCYKLIFFLSQNRDKSTSGIWNSLYRIYQMLMMNRKSHWILMIMILVIVMYLKANYWGEREIHTNTDYSVTVWMLCVIPHIRNYVIYDYDGNNRNQVKKSIII